MELALVHSAISEEDHDCRVLLLHLDSETDSDADWHLSANYRVAAHEVQVGVEQVHRAALAPTRSGRPAAQLCHAGLGVQSPRKRVPVVPVMCDDVVLRLQ